MNKPTKTFSSIYPQPAVWTLVCILAVLLLSACTAIGSSAPLVEAPGAELSYHPTQAASPTSTPYFTLTSPPPPTFTPTSIPASHTATSTKAAPPPTATVVPIPPLNMCSPLENHSWADLEEIVSHPYDPPPTGKDTGHHGVDFAYYRRGDRKSIEGVPIQSVLPGRVAAIVLNRTPYGYMVMVETPSSSLPVSWLNELNVMENESLYLVYAHMYAPPIPILGQWVDCGETLGLVGNTPAGWSSAPHLHFEVRAGTPQTTFESLSYYVSGTTVAERENYIRWRMSGEFRLIDPLSFL
jgi:murein DD-endopeptidase MepM/ murein hydrolase activator NlpD